MSRNQSLDAPVPVPDFSLPSPGALLRQARELRGESVAEVAFALKLNPRQVVALESDDFAALPGMPFVRGFLRNYARYLGLDPAPLLDGVHRLAGEAAVDLSPIKNAEGELPSGGRRRMGTAPIGWIAFLLLLLVLAGWYFDWFRTEQQLVESALDAPVFNSVLVEPESLHAQGPALAQDDSMTQTLAAEGAAPAQEATLASETALAVQDSVAQEAAAPARIPPSAGRVETTASVTQAATTGTDEAVGLSVEDSRKTAVTDSRLAFRFGAESWVEVRDGSGTIVYSGVNRAGSTRTVQGSPPFALVIGNAANVSLEFEGKPVDLAAHIKGSVARLTAQ